MKTSIALDTTDDKNNTCKCSEVRDSDLFSLHEQHESKFEDFNNIQVEKDNLLKQRVDKDKQCDDLKTKYEVEISQKSVKLISAKVDLELLRTKVEITENLKTILALRKHDRPETEGDNLPVLKPSKPGVKECCKFIEVHTS